MWVEEDSIHCFTEPIGTSAEPRNDALPNQSAQPQSFARTKRTATKSFRVSVNFISRNKASLRAANRHCEEQQSVIARNSKPSLRGTTNRHCEALQTVIASNSKASLRGTAKRHCEELQSVIARNCKPSLRAANRHCEERSNHGCNHTTRTF